MNVIPIGKPLMDWSTRHKTTKGHTESHQLVKMGTEITSAEYKDVLRIHKDTLVSPRRGVVHEKVYNPDLKRDEMISHRVEERKCGAASWWQRI